jgi:hypothetical protein
LKEDNVRKKNSLSTSKIKNITEMERAIDQIILDNKDRLFFEYEASKSKEQYSNKINLGNFDVKKISPMNKKKNSIYFVKDKKTSIGKKNPNSNKSNNATKKTDEKQNIANSKNLFESNETKKNINNINKKTTKEINHSAKDEPIVHIDEVLEKINPDDANWLDQQIKSTNTVKEDASKKSSYNVQSDTSSTFNKEMSEQPKRVEKLLGKIKFRKSVNKRVPKKLFLDGQYTKTPEGSDNKFITEEIKPKLTLKKLKKKKQSDVSIKEIRSENNIPDEEIHFLGNPQVLKSKILKDLGYIEGSWEEIDFYPIQEPFAYVEIIREKETLDKKYISIEIGLSKKELDIFGFIKDTLAGSSIDVKELESKGVEKYLIEKIEQIVEDYMIEIDTQSKKKIIYFLEKQFLGLHKLEVLMKDPNIEDISCDGSDVPIFLYHRKYGSLKGNIKFDEEDELSAFVVNLAQKCGKHISIAEPMLDATMPDGSRIQMTLSTEVTAKGSTFTIRKFKEDPFSPPDLIEFNTMSSEMVAYMWCAFTVHSS